MSVYFRLVIGPVVVADVEFFAAKDKPSTDEPPPQLNGGTGTLTYPEPVEDVTLGFTRRTP